MSENYNYVTDDQGRGLIDCSTFIHLVLRGIRYKDSPYYCVDSSNPPIYATFDRDDLQTNIYPWCVHLEASNTLGFLHNTGQTTTFFVRTAAEIAEYFWAAGRVFYHSNSFDPMPGDLVFIRGTDDSRFQKIRHIGIVDFDTSKYYNILNNDHVVCRSLIPTTYGDNNGDVAFFARPFYERSLKEGLPYGNYLEGPWSLTVQTTDNNVIANPSPSDGTIWSGTADGLPANGDRYINLRYGVNKLYLPSGEYWLCGAPSYIDRRAEIGHDRWGLRIRYENNQLITYTAYGFTTPENSDVVDYSKVVGKEVEESRVWDRGYGARFSLANDGWLIADIYIYRYPKAYGEAYTNIDTNTDIWRPCLLRIGDYEEQEQYIIN